MILLLRKYTVSIIGTCHGVSTPVICCSRGVEAIVKASLPMVSKPRLGCLTRKRAAFVSFECNYLKRGCGVALFEAGCRQACCRVLCSGELDLRVVQILKGINNRKRVVFVCRQRLGTELDIACCVCFDNYFYCGWNVEVVESAAGCLHLVLVVGSETGFANANLFRSQTLAVYRASR